MAYLRFFVLFINKLNDAVGSIISILIFPMLFIMLGEVMARYLFNRPTIWAHELCGMLYASYFLLGGAYALRWNAHPRVEIIYVHFSKRLRSLLDLVLWLSFYLFCGALLLKSTGFGWNSIALMEHSDSIWGPPIWPVKLCIPLAALLLLLQGLTKTIGDILTAITGYDFFSQTTNDYETQSQKTRL